MELKPSLKEFLKVIYEYYPRAPIGPDHIFEGFEQTEEHRRLVAARIRAGTDNGQWRALLSRLRARFPDAVEDRSFHLPSGSFDGAYTGKLTLPPLVPGVETELTFLVSFLVPYYVIYRQRWVSPLPGSLPPNEEDSDTVPADMSFEFTEEEAPYARAIAEEIEAIFGYAPMPLVLGKTIVPDAWLDPCECGTATILSYLFCTNGHFW